MVVIDVEVLGGQDAAASHQMVEQAVQWFDPQGGVWDRAEAVGDQSHAEEGLTTWIALSNWLHRRSEYHQTSQS